MLKQELYLNLLDEEMADKPHFFWRSVWTDFIFGRKKLFA
jgi:hypothetical protein